MFNPQDPLFWTLIAFILFFVIVFVKKVPAAIAKSLDDRADGIKKDLDDARKMREEAQELLADYQRRSREAEDEAKDIIARAKSDAEALAADTRKSLAESLERRTKVAEEKIARAEAQALGEVRAAAVDMAVAAAEKILRGKVVGQDACSLIDASIRDIMGRLN